GRSHMPHTAYPSGTPLCRPPRIAVTVALALAVAGVLAACSKTPSTPPTDVTPTHQISVGPSRGDPLGSTTAHCVQTYSPQTLVQRGFAFDGTVVSIGGPTAMGEVVDPYVPVIFAVHHWYRGGQGDRIAVGMFPPGVVTSVGNASYTVGSRLLVS